MCPDVAITISEIVENTTAQEERSRVYNAAWLLNPLNQPPNCLGVY
jgi:hypothetical protein